MSIAFPVQEVLRLFQENRTEALWMDDENDIILRYHGEELIGFTILNPSQR